MSDPKILIPYWEDPSDPLAWDTIILGGEIFPGVATVGGAGIKRDIDIKKADGEDGVSMRDKGMGAPRIDVTLVIYNQSDWERLQGVMPTITPRQKGGSRTPVSFYYPATRLLGINRIYIDSIPVPDFNKRDKQLLFKFTAFEWFPSPKPVKKGAGTSGSNKKDEAKPEEDSDTDYDETPSGKAQKGAIAEKAEEAKTALCNAFPELEECA